MLINNGARVNRVDKSGDTPLITAIKSNHLEIFRCLLGHGADPYAKGRESQSALNIAARLGRAAILEDYVFMVTTPDPEKQKKRWFAQMPSYLSECIPHHQNGILSSQEDDGLEAVVGKTRADDTQRLSAENPVMKYPDRIINSALTQKLERGSTQEWQLQWALSIAIQANQHYAASVLRAHGIEPLQ